MSDYEFFAEMCGIIMRDAHTYTAEQCHDALKGINKLWEGAGAYGNWQPVLCEVGMVLCDRWQVLLGLSRSVETRAVWVGLAEDADASGDHDAAADHYRAARAEQRWAHNQR